MPRKLKVFRMPIGFDDAYVAAPSRKAALAAWGAEHDQFARGVAEEVTDPALIQAPLAHPGEVIRLSRGDLAAQLKAGPPKRKKASAAVVGDAPERKKPKPSPPPKRDELDAAEAALEAAEQGHSARIAALEAEREAIAAGLTELHAKRNKDLAKLVRQRDAAKDAYRAALEKWSE
ncbi:MAG: hypothetical protein B7Z08_09280 [Sphingomonadales bacterium 32-68-7]|nr:MAG: hypothetical protein B7Z33_11915 [Sphingomonadales bacterium 12-68-11]OYX08488.1 MAG: hypothetical protein B7Z08_09280 [Sphingomonadales bacterium 32-68-7]